jgi:hypothetical protein
MSKEQFIFCPCCEIREAEIIRLKSLNAEFLKVAKYIKENYSLYLSSNVLEELNDVISKAEG